MEELSDEVLYSSSVYHVLTKFKPDIIIDCINTATAIAYQDIYTSYRSVKKALNKKSSFEELAEETEKLLLGYDERNEYREHG